MQLRDLTAAVIELQKQYTWSNTPDMERRGQLIRSVIPEQIRSIREALAKAIGISDSDVLIEGRDATGRKSEIPWVRLASRTQSPKATVGWYVVLLFRKDGAGVYLALAHGSTQLNGGSFVPRSDAELKKLMLWGRGVLAKQMGVHPHFVPEIDLASMFRHAAGEALAAYPIRYQPTFPQGSASANGLDMTGVLAKGEAWRYEGEWRLVESRRARTWHDIPSGALEGVVFGARCSDETQAFIWDLVHRRSEAGLPTLHVGKAEIAHGKFELDFRGFDGGEWKPISLE